MVFGGYSHTWRGAKASIYPRPNSKVYGCVWKLDSNESDSLDAQEPEHKKIIGKSSNSCLQVHKRLQYLYIA